MHAVWNSIVFYVDIRRMQLAPLAADADFRKRKSSGTTSYSCSDKNY